MRPGSPGCGGSSNRSCAAGSRAAPSAESAIAWIELEALGRVPEAEFAARRAELVAGGSE
jgi:hypothetical protein